MGGFQLINHESGSQSARRVFTDLDSEAVGWTGRRAGYRYDLSVLQVEFSLTQMWDCRSSGRGFFAQVIRENLDLGRPEQVQLMFCRKLQRKTVAGGR
jgi:hypothetical protein